MKWQNIWIVIVLLILLLWSMINQHSIEQQARRSSATVHSLGSTGQQIFYDYRQSQYPEETIILKRAILSAELLPKQASLIIAAPLRPISNMEAEVILDRVAAGAQVYLTLHEERHRENLLAILNQLPLPQIRRNVQYYQGLLEKRRIPEQQDAPSSFARAGEEYAFYSSFVFHDDECLEERFYCFIREIPWEDGTILLQLGLPLSSNALLAESDNPRLLSRFSLNRPQLIFDEYHHFYEEADIYDFLTDLSLMAPLLGLVIVCILAMSVHDRRRYWPEPARRLTTSKQWHDLMIGILEKKLQHADFQKQSLELQLGVLMRLYPEGHQEWQAILDKMRSSTSWSAIKETIDRTHLSFANNRRARADDKLESRP
ncbi:MAG: hypothetical protein ACOH5I_01350 [Oligoflexus sp.]